MKKFILLFPLLLLLFIFYDDYLYSKGAIMCPYSSLSDCPTNPGGSITNDSFHNAKQISIDTSKANPHSYSEYFTKRDYYYKFIAPFSGEYNIKIKLKSTNNNILLVGFYR